MKTPEHYNAMPQLSPSNRYELFEKTRGKKLRNTTWCLGDKPCKTLVKQSGSWVDITKA